MRARSILRQWLWLLGGAAFSLAGLDADDGVRILLGFLMLAMSAHEGERRGTHRRAVVLS